MVGNVCPKNFNNAFVCERKCNQCDGKHACLSFAVYHRTIYTLNLGIKICWRLDFLSFHRPFFVTLFCKCLCLQAIDTRTLFHYVWPHFPRILVGNRLVYCNLCWKPITNFPFNSNPLSISPFKSLAFECDAENHAQKKTPNDITNYSDKSEGSNFIFVSVGNQNISKAFEEIVKIKLNKSDPHQWHRANGSLRQSNRQLITTLSNVCTNAIFFLHYPFNIAAVCMDISFGDCFTKCQNKEATIFWFLRFLENVISHQYLNESHHSQVM